MELIEPTIAYAESFTEAMQEFGDVHIPGLIDEAAFRAGVVPYIKKLQQFAEGKNLPEGYVPSSTYWLVNNTIFIAHVNIRHKLNERLRLIGGHIGYAVRPSEQGKGYGSKLLELALPKARVLGLTKVLITCDADNIGSRKVIEKNGGIFQQEQIVDGKPILQFFIDLN
jgi:predicted acetyltransferase